MVVLEVEAATWHTRQSDDLHLPSSSLSIYQNGTYFTGIKFFNKLPL
jgi:hypothetical protein